MEIYTRATEQLSNHEHCRVKKSNFNFTRKQNIQLLSKCDMCDVAMFTQSWNRWSGLPTDCLAGFHVLLCTLNIHQALFDNMFMLLILRTTS